jgi:hypothetical protein
MVEGRGGRPFFTADIRGVLVARAGMPNLKQPPDFGPISVEASS